MKRNIMKRKKGIKFQITNTDREGGSFNEKVKHAKHFRRVYLFRIQHAFSPHSSVKNIKKA